jgi:uncharacterized protein with HEPN domain
MSDAAPPRAWRFYVEDMVSFIDKALGYMNGVDRASFALDPMRYDATLRNLELIGEAATHVPDEVRTTAPDVPWRLVVAVRNRLIHGYLGVNEDTLWSILRDDLPPLRVALVRLLAQRPEE